MKLSESMVPIKEIVTEDVQRILKGNGFARSGVSRLFKILPGNK